MNGQKSSRVDLVEKKIKALTNVMQGIMDDMAQMKHLSIGTLETIKLMPDYDEALDKLKEKIKYDEDFNVLKEHMKKEKEDDVSN
jgi:hypothetical protein